MISSSARFIHRSRINVSADELFAWHARPGAFERLQPPWERVEVVERTGGIEDGARVVLRVGPGPFRLRWVLEHQDHIVGRQFCDRQIHGPFAEWRHLHRIEPIGDESCTLEERIDYRLPLDRIARIVIGKSIQGRLRRLFTYRHRVTANDLAVHRDAKEESPMRVLVTGSTGLIGSTLVPFLTTGGHEVIRLVRPQSRTGGKVVRWDPEKGTIDAAALENLDAVVHLAGESIASGRWTRSRKQRIWNSRIESTRLLSETLAGLDRRPRVLVSASASGIYGTRGEEILSEESEGGKGFLAELTRHWEEASEAARASGIRVVHLRTGVVLHPGGGALAKMLPIFRFGLGGRIGRGDQYMSWIALDDLIMLIHHAIENEATTGAINAVSPQPVTNREFTRTLAKLLGRPALFPVPAAFLRLVFGEMADETLLTSQRIEPRRAIATGYRFRFPDLEGALRHLLGKTTED